MPDLILHPERLTNWNKNRFRRLPRTRFGVRRNDGVEFTHLMGNLESFRGGQTQRCP